MVSSSSLARAKAVVGNQQLKITYKNGDQDRFADWASIIQVMRDEYRYIECIGTPAIVHLVPREGENGTTFWECQIEDEVAPNISQNDVLCFNSD